MAASGSVVETDRRTARYRARDFLRYVTGLKRVRECGHSAVTPGGAVGVRATGTGSGRTAGFSGLATCGSVWACPVCASKVACERVETIAAAASSVIGDGGSVLLLTLTMRHSRGDGLAAEWDALTRSWQAVTNSRGWRDERERYGLLGWARAVEATHGVNGWHLHAHVLLFTDRQLDDREAAAWESAIHGRWSRSLARRGFSARAGVGTDLRVLHSASEAVAAYPVKSLAWEAVGGHGKVGRSASSRTPFRILADLMASGVVDQEDDGGDLALWHEWEAASFGRRQLTWSRGFLASLNLTDRSDEEIAADEIDGETLAVLPSESWALVRSDVALRVAILQAAEADETGHALHRLLYAHRIAFFTWDEWREFGTGIAA